MMQIDATIKTDLVLVFYLDGLISFLLAMETNKPTLLQLVPLSIHTHIFTYVEVFIAIIWDILQVKSYYTKMISGKKKKELNTTFSFQKIDPFERFESKSNLPKNLERGEAISIFMGGISSYCFSYVYILSNWEIEIKICPYHLPSH